MLRSTRNLQVSAHKESKGRVLLLAIATGTFAGDFKDPLIGSEGITFDMGTFLLQPQQRAEIFRSNPQFDQLSDRQDRCLALGRSAPSVRPLVRKLDAARLCQSFYADYTLPITVMHDMTLILTSALRGVPVQTADAELLAHKLWVSETNGQVRFLLQAGQLRFLLLFLTVTHRYVNDSLFELAQEMERAFILRRFGDPKPFILFQNFENFVNAALMIRLGAEAAICQGKTQTSWRLLESVTSVRVPTSARTSHAILLNEVSSWRPDEGKVAWVSSNETCALDEQLGEAVRALPYGACLLVKANCCSNSTHEPFDTLVFMKSQTTLFVWAIDCHSALTITSYLPAQKEHNLVEKCKKLRSRLVLAGL